MCVAEFEHVFTSVYSYVSVFSPLPAATGSKIVPEIPAEPVTVPPAGDTCNTTSPPSIHTLASPVIVTVGFS